MQNHSNYPAAGGGARGLHAWIGGSNLIIGRIPGGPCLLRGQTLASTRDKYWGFCAEITQAEKHIGSPFRTSAWRGFSRRSPASSPPPPPWVRPTRAGDNIYASVITAAASSTGFFLACTSVWRSASACSQLSGVTLTYGDNTMRIGFKRVSLVYDVSSPSTMASENYVREGASVKVHDRQFFQVRFL
ncbi:uncharacterized protein LY79DRAFT_683344 [Colletotrichum navitas]|uniref:Uncharacterized protein n=1 Tax=Colletotrichum navitas TaxID=681940 RepID=A0AAD8QB07_9PEZI|nr:uncharacterized protein LY79DRAFT_683344 [Colletotrichum navitas]KAK1599340.1 hypothetical protein LY79DRAFT_683344 [Colletotrichum navitas]